MAGSIILAGGAEFGGQMAEVDRRALELAGGLAAPVRIIPAAAAPDHNERRAGGNGQRWFSRLGARDVAVAPLTDRASADDPAVVAALRDARLIYLLGGFTHHLAQSLIGSQSWAAIVAAHAAGAVVAGSSAGAMVLCAHYLHPERNTVLPGLGLVPEALVIPHHNSFGAGWAPRLAAAHPALSLLGIDERTALIDDGPAGAWHVYGQGGATIYRAGQQRRYRTGETAL
jgi:cyanophycinase